MVIDAEDRRKFLPEIQGEKQISRSHSHPDHKASCIGKT
jgi:hypothetical protein